MANINRAITQERFLVELCPGFCYTLAQKICTFDDHF